MDKIRLNIGAGETTIPGFTPIDAALGHDALKLPYGDNSVDEVYASHILEHFDRGESDRAIVEWMRVLKPGGRIRIAVPDVDKILAKRRTDPLWEHRLMGGHTDGLNFHKTAWFEDKLRDFMQYAGLERVSGWKSEYTDCSSHSISANMQGFKRGDFVALHERPIADGPIRLNIGAGESGIPGFVSIDMRLGHDALNLDYANDSVDEVYASHVLEHVHHSKVEQAVCEWVRVLKPGGKIRIAVPDFEKVFEEFRAGRMHPQTLSAWLHGSFDVDTDRHQAVITKEYLSDMLRRSGLDDLQTFEPEYADCTTNAISGPMSLNFMGYKREVKIPREPKVAMVISVPRVGFTDPYKSIADACTELGWLFYPRGGTEWGKGMEAACQGIIENLPVDYIVCLDYDSAFEVDDLRKLLKFMQERPDVLAAWPAEMHRHLDLPLGMNPDGAAQGVYGEQDKDSFVRMWSGHFGCTIIRRQVFEKLPHPWFWSLPDPVTGDWKNGSDADVTFWRSMHNFGMKFGQVNDVVIGHGELCYKWPAVDKDGNARVIWQPVQNYRAKGRPKDAVFDFKAWVRRAENTLGVKRLEPKPVVAEIPPSPIHPPKPIKDATPELDEVRSRVDDPAPSLSKIGVRKNLSSANDADIDELRRAYLERNGQKAGV